MSEKRLGPGVGIVSVLMIFVTLCLALFAVLTYATAAADWRMTKRTVLSMTQYYDAEGQAVLLADGAKEAALAKELAAYCEENALSLSEEETAFSVGGRTAVGENRELCWSVRIEKETGALTVTEWRTETAEGWRGDETHPLFENNASGGENR